MPRVAVVIPAFNPGRFLHEAVQSVIDQTFSDWECVVVDDGGREDLSWVRRADRRVRLVTQRNAGVAAARNCGISETVAPLIALLDQDDVWRPEKLDAQVSQLQAHPQAPGCSCDFEMVNAEGRRIGRGFSENFYSYRDLLRGCGLVPSTMVVRRSAVAAAGGFNARYRFSGDWDLWLRLARDVGAFERVESVLVSYRRHDANESLKYKQLLTEGEEILRRHIDGEESGAARDGLRRFRRVVGGQAFDAFRAHRRPSALLDALYLAPEFTIRSMLRYLATKGGRRLKP